MFINVFLQANNLFNQEIITSVIGVIATLVGTILGWFLNNLSNRGKLTIFTFLWKENFRRKTSFEKKMIFSVSLGFLPFFRGSAVDFHHIRLQQPHDGHLEGGALLGLTIQ